MDTIRQYVFNIDRGGTFTDFYVQEFQKQKLINSFSFKVLSEGQKGEGPIIGMKQFLKAQTGTQSEKIGVSMVKKVNLGTTIATNALLERKGVKNALIVTKGFKDILQIRHQARPNIFDLTCSVNPPLYDKVYQLDQRVYLEYINYDLQKVNGNRQKPFYCKKPNIHQLQQIIADIQKQGINSVAVSFCNAYLYKQHQIKVKEQLQKAGIKNIELGNNYKDIGYLKRTQTANLDSFLNLKMKEYFNNFLSNFDDPQNLNIRVMRSDGGFGNIKDVKASELLLSGPAGGLIGYSQLIDFFQSISNIHIKNLIGLDMGGTSTDVSRLSQGKLQITYNFAAEGLQICTPHLLIDTIAAGGGSELSFQNGMFKVGPESVGSNPGPVCYGKGQKLALTDANLILNRLDVDSFPKIFGENRNSGLDVKKSMEMMTKLTEQINKKIQVKKSVYDVAEGFVEIANELMAKSARKLLTLGKPDALVIFGSAGGQHCCDLAKKIGVSHIFIHKYSGILSAYGLSKASSKKEYKQYLGMTINKEDFKYQNLIKQLKARNCFQQNQNSEIDIGIRYEGTSNAISIRLSQYLIQNFIQTHEKQNGFKLEKGIFCLDYYREISVVKEHLGQQILQQAKLQSGDKFIIKHSQVYLNGKMEIIPFYKLNDMKNCIIQGPALLLSQTSSIVIKKNWIAKIVSLGIYIEQKVDVQQNEQIKKQIECDPIKLTLYSTRLMSIAEEMGKMLQKTSISTNIKQRLDFSCGIFDQDGKLLANAPHLPVHLGSMETAVIQQLNRGIKNRDVILTNHPQAGGSHLPDLTVVTAIQIGSGIKLFLASRGHHADIGGSTPGSMPPFSRTLAEEGVGIEKFNLITNGIFEEAQLRNIFKKSRRVDDNISDIKAQIAANEIGTKLLSRFIEQEGEQQFKTYLKFICDNACKSVENLLYDFSLKKGMKQSDTVEAIEYMDDGTPLKLSITINRFTKTATFDFTGSGRQVIANTNAPKSITKSAILYCLRCLIGTEIPLNSGCLRPIKIIIPENSILSPSKMAAVVGGNVETSQRLVDLILKPFQIVAASQGTMNNFLFGNQNCCYYQTICGGSGASFGHNGRTVQCHMTNTRTTDAEHLEAFYPVIVAQFAKRTLSGGKGKFKGGEGAIRELIFLEPMEVSILSQRRCFEPYGIKGGGNGCRGINILIGQDKIQKNIGGKNIIKVQKYDRVRIQTPGGGGYGKEEQN